MGYAEARARQEQLRAAGALPGAKGTGTRATLGRKSSKVPLLMAPCPHLGKRLSGGCGSLLRQCNHFGDVTTQFTPCPDAQRCCQSCDEHPARKT